MKYLNIKTNLGVETVDQLDCKDFKTFKEFKIELKRLISEYHLANIPVYVSTRPDKTWSK